MSSCAGPYTRVFFDSRDAGRLQGLADALAGGGWDMERSSLPRGRGGMDDLSCEMYFVDGTQIRAAKFLGPKGLMKQRHVYELDVAPPADAERRHLFGDNLSDLIDRFLTEREALRAGEPVEGAIAGAEAHETRIELCNGL